MQNKNIMILFAKYEEWYVNGYKFNYKYFHPDFKEFQSHLRASKIVLNN